MSESQRQRRENAPATAHVLIAAALLLVLGTGCVESGGGNGGAAPLVVDSTGDGPAAAALGTTLREALETAVSNQPIEFDPSLDGATIALTELGEAHTILKGEVMGIDMTPSGPVSYLVGYFDRDYGRSALYAQKNVVIDASDLPSGVTIEWTGGRTDPARVLAVLGDLTLRNVRITGGVNLTEDISTPDPDDQPWTLARGGGIAVWGLARLEDCEIFDNHVEGDFDPSRDRGAFGGGVYANLVRMERCVVAGNSVLGGGAAGGGVFSVGGALDAMTTSTIDDSSISGNRIQGLFTYGGGVYSDGGGIGNRKRLVVRNSTLATNLVEPAPGLPSFVLASGYWRGGGLYLSNGYVQLESVTIVENEVHGVPRTDDLDKPNLAGGVAATIGNAHAVEDMVIGHSIIAGNTVHEIDAATYDVVATYDHDVFTGSSFYFRSLGYNRLGVLDFSQMLVPIGQPDWRSLSRRHFPQPGDLETLTVDEVVERTSGITRSSHIESIGTDAGQLAVLHYEPWDRALDQIPDAVYPVLELFGEYSVRSGGVDDFLAIALDRIESHYALPGFAASFTADFEAFLASVDLDDTTPGNQPYTDSLGAPILTLADTLWFGPAVTWPRELPNHPYIHFWHRLDTALHAEGIPGMGSESLGDAAWAALFSSGPLAENPDIVTTIWTRHAYDVGLADADQVGRARPVDTMGDVGAIERP